MKSAFVSIVSKVASGPSRSSTGLVNVPTPGPYSTNSLVLSQSTGSSIRSMRTRLDGMIEPTITGFLMKPRRNCQCGLGERRSRWRWSLRGLFSVRAGEVGMDAPFGARERGALANAPPIGKVERDMFVIGPAVLRNEGLSRRRGSARAGRCLFIRPWLRLHVTAASARRR